MVENGYDDYVAVPEQLMIGAFFAHAATTRRYEFDALYGGAEQGSETPHL